MATDQPSTLNLGQTSTDEHERNIMIANCRSLIVFFAASFLVACNMPVGPFGMTPVATRTALPDAEASATPSPLPPSATPSPDWEALLPGFELRIMEMWIEGFDSPVAVTVIRIDPDQFSIRVHYSQRNPGKVAGFEPSDPGGTEWLGLPAHSAAEGSVRPSLGRFPGVRRSAGLTILTNLAVVSPVLSPYLTSVRSVTY